MSQSEDRTVIEFAEGVIGVPRARRFQLLERAGSPIRVLRCLDIDGFNLPVVDPRLVDPGYAPRLDRRVARALGIEDSTPVLFLAVTALEEGGPVANLRAPIVVNTSRACGAQVILEDRTLPLRIPVPAAGTAAPRLDPVAAGQGGPECSCSREDLVRA